MSSGILPCGLTTRRRDESTAGRNWRKLWNGLSTRSSSHARIPHISRSIHWDEDQSGHLRLVGQGVEPSISGIIFYFVVLIRHETTPNILILSITLRFTFRDFCSCYFSLLPVWLRVVPIKASRCEHTPVGNEGGEGKISFPGIWKGHLSIIWPYFRTWIINKIS